MNNKGFSQIENLLALALFSFLILQLIGTLGQMHKDQSLYKNRVTASQIAESVAGEFSVVGLSYKWLKSDTTHERYFDYEGNETEKKKSKYTVKWTVTPDKPITGMKMADFLIEWKDGGAESRDMKFRITR